MNRTVGIALVAALAIALGAYLLWHNEAKAPTATTYNWTFADAGQSAAGNPQTALRLNGRLIGKFDGSCQEIDGSGWDLLPGEQSGVICWYAGGGSEIGIFDGVVKQGELDEGSAEIPGTRGNFKTLFTL